MDIVTVCGVAVLCLVAATTVRTLKPDLATLLRLAFCILFGGGMLLSLRPLVAALQTIMDATAADYTATLLKALGIACLTHLTAELCRDCGENSVAGGVETLGKLEILSLCLPLIGAVMETVGDILSW